MTSPVRTRTICLGATVTSCAAARSKPADSAVPYAGRETVESSRLILSRIRAAYLVTAWLLLAPAAAPAQDRQDLNAPLPLDIAIRTGTLPNGLTFFIRHNA